MPFALFFSLFRVRERAGLRVGSLLLATLLGGPAFAQDLRKTTVTVTDHLSAGQQEETITVYFAGVLAGTLHVEPGRPDDSFVTTVPDRDHLGYSLCGKLRRREDDGTLSDHPIDNAGVLMGYAGQTLAATTLGDVLFSLQGESDGGATTVQPGPACTAAVS